MQHPWGYPLHSLAPFPHSVWRKKECAPRRLVRTPLPNENIHCCRDACVSPACSKAKRCEKPNGVRRRRGWRFVRGGCDVESRGPSLFDSFWISLVHHSRRWPSATYRYPCKWTAVKTKFLLLETSGRFAERPIPQWGSGLMHWPFNSTTPTTEPTVNVSISSCQRSISIKAENLDEAGWFFRESPGFEPFEGDLGTQIFGSVWVDNSVLKFTPQFVANHTSGDVYRNVRLLFLNHPKRPYPWRNGYRNYTT